MNALVETVIAKVLSPYLEGVSRENLQLGLVSGHLQLSQLQVKQSLLTELHLHQASFDKASVQSVSVTIPWRNMLSGKIVIAVSGVDVRVRVNEQENLDRDKLVAFKRDIIDSLKAGLSLSQPLSESTSLRPDSFTAKLVRRIVDAIIVRVTDVCIAFVVPNAPEIDDEGFQDAVGDSPIGATSELSLSVKCVSIEDQESSGSTNQQQVSKRLAISGVCLRQGTALMVPELGLELSVSHNMHAGTFGADIRGFDECDIRISDEQLDICMQLVSKLFGDKNGAVGSFTPAEMSLDAKAAYTALYRQFLNMESELWTEARRSTKYELDQMALLFDPKAIATCEHHVESERKKRENGNRSSSSWFSGWWKQTSDDPSLLIHEIEAGEEIQIPLSAKVTLSMGTNWTISLLSKDEAITRIQLDGALVDFSLQTEGLQTISKIYFASRGLGLLHRGEAVVDFNPHAHGSFHRSRSSFRDFNPSGSSFPLEVWVDFVSGQSSSLNVKLCTKPVRLSYIPGLVRDMKKFFAPILETGPQLVDQQLLVLESMKRIQQLQEIASSMGPKTISFELKIAGPVVTVPSSDRNNGEFITVYLGNLHVNQPPSIFSLETCSDPFQAILDQVALSVSSPASSIQVLSPSPIELSGFLDGPARMIRTSLVMNETTACRLSPDALHAFSKLVGFILSELDDGTAVPSIVDQTKYLNRESTRESEDSKTIEFQQEQVGPNIQVLVACSVKKFDLMVSDGSTDVVNVIVAVPELAVGYSIEKNEIGLSIESVRFVVRCLNRATGDWEPVIEPTTYSVFAQSGVEGKKISIRSTGTSIVCSPNSIGVIRDLIAEFTYEKDESNVKSKYRVVNATRKPFVLSLGKRKHKITLPPSDSFEAIDDKVLKYGARQVELYLESEQMEVSPISFSLDEVFVSQLKDGLHCVHALSGPSFRTVLVSQTVFVINQCDVPLEVSGIDPSVPTPEADLLGAIVFRGPTVSIRKASDHDSLILNPGRFVSISLGEKISIRPLIGGERSWAPLPIDLKNPSMVSLELNGFFMRVEVEVRDNGICFVHIRPPLVVVNNLPIAIKLKHSTGGKQVFVTVPQWECVAIYSCEAREDFSSFNAAIAFMNEESEWSLPILSGESRHLLSPDLPEYKEVHLTTTERFSREVSVSAKWWLVNRLGPQFQVKILDAESGLVLPSVDDGRVFLLPDPDVATTVQIRLVSPHVGVWEQPLVDGGWVPGFLGTIPVVLNSKETLQDKYVELVPRYTLYNALPNEVIAIDKSNEFVEPNTGIPLMHAKDGRFRFNIGAAASSCEVPLAESFAGIWPVVVGQGSVVCRVEIAPVNGCVHVTIRSGSSITVRNRKRSRTVYIEADHGKVFAIPPNNGFACIGWADPFRNATVSTMMRIGTDGEPFCVPLAKVSETVAYGPDGCVRVMASSEPQSIEIVVFPKDEILQQNDVSSAIAIELEIEKLGFSLVRNRKELIYTELLLIRALVKQSEESKLRIAILVSEIQVETAVSKHNARPVVVANNGEASRPFIEALLELSTNVSSGIVAVSQLHVQFDSLFVEVDSDLATALDEFLGELIDVSDDPRSSMAAREHTKELLVHELVPIKRGTVIPVAVPSILILDSLFVSRLDVELWVDFALKSMVFMPASLKLIVGMLSLGRSFKLDGAKVLIRPRAVEEYKGSAEQFFQSLLRDYTVESLRNAASLLGNSSLLAIPRVPLKFVSGVGSKGLEKAAGAVGGLVAMISDITADRKYREQQQKIRRQKKIAGVADGFIEGANRLGEGLGGVLDIFKKPMEGAKREGALGFVKGLGKGLVGTLVKPLSKVGEALGDVGTGIAKSVAPSSRQANKMVYVRRRIPRAFYGKSGIVDDYKVADAMLHASLPVNEMETVIALKNSQLLIGFSDNIVIVDVKVQRDISLLSVHGTSTPPLLDELQSEPSEGFIPVASREPSSLEDVPLMDVQFSIVEEFQACDVIESIPNVKALRVRLSLSNDRNLDMFVDLRPDDDYARKLIVALSEALTPNGSSFDWKNFKRELREYEFAAPLQKRDERPDFKVTESTLVEVWEVERFLMAYGWVTPFMMLDVETSWRWVDQSMHKHPRIDGRLSRKECAKTKSPPLVFGELIKPQDEWHVTIDAESTDPHGWIYAISFSSSTWQSAPGIAASVRKRRWVRPIS
jgi:hypothetical protein